MDILVLSDLHCKYKTPGRSDNSTRLFSNALPLPRIKHPIEALKQIIEEDKITADIILCPGDIADKSDDQGYISGFKFLSEIKTHVKAKHLISTIGNHDVDSRQLFFTKFDDLPRNLNDTFPFDDQTLREKFWANNFCLFHKENIAVLVFNSSYSHSTKDNASKSIIEESTIEQMEDAIKKLPADVEYKIALCHHHPNKHHNIDYRDEDVIDKGDLLLSLLNKYEFQILIHGHKHDPRVNYFNSLPVLCAGSFSSLQNVRELAADNIFHIVTLTKNSRYGKIKSYTYGVSSGWHIKSGAYFPCFTGFGYQDSINTLADKCNSWFLKKNQDLISFADIILDIPDIEFLIPVDQEKLNTALKRHGLTFTPELPDLPKFICKEK